VPSAASDAYGPLDVRTFGAKGDGMNDDSAAIQQAIDKAQQESGSHITEQCHGCFHGA
jgi:polygalacturonase